MGNLGDDRLTSAAILRPLAELSNEAAAFLDRARQFRARMDGLPVDDPRRAELEQAVRDLLKSANTLSDAVKRGTKY